MTNNPMTGSQEKFIINLAEARTISEKLKNEILDKINNTTISLPEASRLIKALLELDFNYLYNFTEGNNGD